MTGLAGALVRLAVLAVLFVNQALVVYGWNPIPFSEEDLYAFFSTVALGLQALWTWYKNNSLTKEAQKADEFMADLKAEKAVRKRNQ